MDSICLQSFSYFHALIISRKRLKTVNFVSLVFIGIKLPLVIFLNLPRNIKEMRKRCHFLDVLQPLHSNA